MHNLHHIPSMCNLEAQRELCDSVYYGWKDRKTFLHIAVQYRQDKVYEYDQCEHGDRLVCRTIGYI